MNREQKAVVIDEIATNIQDSQAIFAVDYRGITVPQAAELRDKLRAVDASFRVVKNSLTERAAEKAGVAELKGLLAGPTALTFVRGDAATAAKAIADYARVTQRLAFKGGVMDGLTLTPDQVSAISRLLSREALYGQLVGLVASPLTGLVRTLNALVGGLAIQLGAILEKKESGEIPAGDPPAPAPVEEIPTDVAEEAAPVAEAETPPASEEPAEAQAAPAGGEPAEAQAAPASEEPTEVQAAPTGDGPAEAQAVPAGDGPAEAQAAPVPAVDAPTTEAAAEPEAANVSDPGVTAEPEAANVSDPGVTAKTPADAPAAETPATEEPPSPVADPPVAEPPHPAEAATADPPPTETPTPDSADKENN